MHNASKVLLGSIQSSYGTIDNRAGAIPAGKIVRLKSDDTISLLAADGNALGMSLGRDLSGTSRTAICRRGVGVPILLTAAFTPTKGAQVAIDDVTGIAKAAGSGVTAVNATYVSGILEGVDEDGADCDVALIDFPGGL